jgi:hypothetical protein
MLYDHRVDFAVDLRSAGDRLVKQFLGADLFPADEISKANRVIAAVFPKCHLHPPSARSAEIMATPASGTHTPNSAEHVRINDVLTDRLTVEGTQDIARGLLAHPVDGLPRHARDMRRHDDVRKREQRMP